MINENNEKMTRALELRKTGDSSAALPLLKECVSEADSLESRLMAATETLRVLVHIYSNSSASKPAPNSPEYAELRKYLKIAADSYVQADFKTQEDFSINNFTEVLDLMSDDDKQFFHEIFVGTFSKRLEKESQIRHRLESLSEEFADSESIISSFDKASDFNERIYEWNLVKRDSFPVYDSKIVDESRRMAGIYKIVIALRDGDAGIFELYTSQEKLGEKSLPSGAKSGGCFVATAAYGSPLAPEVVLLSQFRDKVLLNSAFGRMFVAFYYFVSPPLASVIAKAAFLRATARAVLITPILHLLKAAKFNS